MRPDKTCHNLDRALCKDYKRCTFHRVFGLREKAKTHYLRVGLEKFRYDRDEDNQRLRWATHCGIQVGYRVRPSTVYDRIRDIVPRLVFETLTGWQRPPIFPSEDPSYEVFIRCGTSWQEILATNDIATCTVCAKSTRPIQRPNKVEDPWIYVAPQDPQALFDRWCVRT